MLFRPSSLLPVALVTGAALAGHHVKSTTPPIVQLDRGSFVGTSDGTVDSFLGIPFAKPPVGDLRFRLPVPNDPYNTTRNATAFGPACPQQNAVSEANFLVLPPETVQFILTNYTKDVGSGDEDCLTVNVITPTGTKPNANLPVAVWIYGGGFETGGTSGYDGTPIVKRSIELGEPVIYVSLNYRLNGFGFLASKEVKEAGVGNLGMQDQRQALRWVHKYISAFGGDPKKVTIWGESAGGISVALHLVTNGGNTEGLFRAAFMQSGSPIPIGDITEGQIVYDQLVEVTLCSGAADTLQCLREVPYEVLKAAIDNTPGLFSYQPALNEVWIPRADGKFLVDTPQRLVLQGSVAKVPFVTGDCDDEGTLFSLTTLNVTTEAQLATYLQQTYFPRISQSDLSKLLQYYPADVTQGSPFNTGTANAVTPEFKRHAAIIGDLVFQAPRRLLLQEAASRQNTWVFLFKRFKSLGVLGAFHGTDVIDIYGGSNLTSHLVHFVHHLNPNGAGVPAWPQFSLQSRQLLTLLDGDTPETVGQDNYRAEGMALLTKVLLETPL
ncbi:alpha/beta-hydrolase [Dichomitus squalens]|uniref:Carboxylic ester hydrolase n=1 Tax=Dichomitus squalens TaxID=114155 RepID=A0A4V2K3N0_9APHY|nr:alpha/beta-hydrolase [Dichomitus squalens]TBU58061.1 alpha/beta-hydrolase [Dichomitus squalens]